MPECGKRAVAQFELLLWTISGKLPCIKQARAPTGNAERQRNGEEYDHVHYGSNDNFGVRENHLDDYPVTGPTAC